MPMTVKEMGRCARVHRPFFVAYASGSLPMARVTRQKRRPVFSRTEQRAIVLEALKILPNVLEVYRCLGKRIGISYGTIWKRRESRGHRINPL
jgi:hypothetical protein